MRAILRLSTSVLLLATLGACASMTPPKVDVPDNWQATADAENQNAGLPDAKWWRNFQSSELSGLIEEALASNFGLKAAVARILQAEASAKIAGAALYPSLGADFGAGRSGRQTPNGPTIKSDSFQASLQASYQLDLFGEVRNSAASASQRLESSLYDRETVTITLISDVTNTYLQVLSARERLQLTTDRLQNAESILRLLETQRRIGTLSDLELAQQRSALASQRAALPALRLAERQALDALAVLLGRNPQGFDVSARTLDDVALPAIAAGLPSMLLVRRPDLRRAESDLRAANFDVKAARAARLPSIGLTASGGTASSQLSELFSTGTFLYNFGGSVAESIFDAGRLQGQEQGARARYREIAANYQNAVISAFSDVENALTAVDQIGQQSELAREASRNADLAYRLAELRYRAGVVDFQTVLNAQNAAFSAQESVVQNQLARFTAVVGLATALGGGWDGAVPAAPPLRTVYDPL
jgi:multidrug efflux system outer membrane protein